MQTAMAKHRGPQTIYVMSHPRSERVSSNESSGRRGVGTGDDGAGCGGRADRSGKRTGSREETWIAGMSTAGDGGRTAVMDSIQSMKGSDVMYRESERAYSFHSWAKRPCDLGIEAWLKTKYPLGARGAGAGQSAAEALGTQFPRVTPRAEQDGRIGFHGGVNVASRKLVWDVFTPSKKQCRKPPVRS